MDGKALSVLKRLSHLKELVIMDTGKVRYTPVNGPAWKAIADVQSLKTLTLYLVPIESIAFREACVGDGFQALTELSLTNGSMKDPALANMKNLVSLEILDLSWNSITDVVFKRIYGLPQLREIDVGSCKRIKTIPPLIELPSLEKLSMSGTKISDASIRNVSMFPGLKCLDISFCNISMVGFRHLFDTQLTRVRCWCNKSITADQRDEIKRKMKPCIVDDDYSVKV